MKLSPFTASAHHPHRVGRSASMAAFAFGATTALVVAVASPAVAADPSTTACPSTYACIWEDSNYKTNGDTQDDIRLKMYIPILAQYYYGGWRPNNAGTTINGHDSASSVFNNGAVETAYFFKNENHGGVYFTKHTGGVDSDLGNGSPAGDFNDSLDSIYFDSFYND